MATIAETVDYGAAGKEDNMARMRELGITS